MIYLAYDGSINGDWIAWYAVGMAAHDPERRLRILHVATGESAPGDIQAKIEDIERRCQAAGVAAESSVVPSSGDVARDLIVHVDGGANTIMVCGARVRSGGRGYLSGTVSERLLDHPGFEVMAIRVVQPGLLGAPRRFLFPVAGDPVGLQAGMDLLRRFAPMVEHVHLLHVVMVKRLVFRRLRREQASRLRDKGWRNIERIEADLLVRTGLAADKLGVDVVVSDDWAHEMIIAAGRHKSQLILLESPRRKGPGGFFYGDPVEVALRDAPCDVAVYRGAER